MPEQLKVGQELKFLTGSYLLLAWDTDKTGTHLAILLDEYKGEFIVCTFRDGWNEWGMGQYFNSLHGAVVSYIERTSGIMGTTSWRGDR